MTSVWLNVNNFEIILLQKTKGNKYIIIDKVFMGF